MKKRLISALAAACMALVMYAGDGYASVSDTRDSITASESGQYTIPSPSDSVTSKPRKNIFRKLIDYVNEARRPKPEKSVDFSILVGPHYSSDKGFGAGIFGTGIYRTDSLTPLSNNNTYLDATTKAHFKLGVYGIHIFPRQTSRLEYDLAFFYIKTKFWGIGYDNDSNDSNESDYRYLAFDGKLEYGIRLVENFYVGPAFRAQYMNARKMQKPWLWEGQKTETWTYGPGLTAVFDTRDCITEPHSGTRLALAQYFFPRGLGNEYPFSMTEFSASGYLKAWKGAVMASNLHTRLTYGDTPWNMLSILGSPEHMRGYFEGRYRDKCSFDFCLELRQHLFGPHGFVVWGGCGAVFPKLSRLTARIILPNYGLGYRFEFKDRVNIRLDYGFGRGQSGIIFSINEAF